MSSTFKSFRNVRVQTGWAWHMPNTSKLAARAGFQPATPEGVLRFERSALKQTLPSRYGSEYGIPTHDTFRYTCSPNKRLRALGQLTVKPMAETARFERAVPVTVTLP